MCGEMTAVGKSGCEKDSWEASEVVGGADEAGTG